MLFSQSPVISAQLTMTVHVCGAASVQTVQDVFSDRKKKDQAVSLYCYRVWMHCLVFFSFLFC